MHVTSGQCSFPHKTNFAWGPRLFLSCIPAKEIPGSNQVMSRSDVCVMLWFKGNWFRSIISAFVCASFHYVMFAYPDISWVLLNAAYMLSFISMMDCSAHSFGEQVRLSWHAWRSIMFFCVHLVWYYHFLDGSSKLITFIDMSDYQILSISGSF